MSDLEAWDRRTGERLERAYLTAGAGPGVRGRARRRIEPYGLELLPVLAELARSLHPELADGIWTGSVMTWKPPRRFTYVTGSTTRSRPIGSRTSSRACSRSSSRPAAG